MSPEEREGREDIRFLLALEVAPGLAHPSLGVSLLGQRPSLHPSYLQVPPRFPHADASHHHLSLAALDNAFARDIHQKPWPLQ